MRAKNGESTGACRSGDRKKTGDRLTSPSGQKGKMLIRSHLREETVTREEQLQTASQLLRMGAGLGARAVLAMLAEEVEELVLQAYLQAAE